MKEKPDATWEKGSDDLRARPHSPNSATCKRKKAEGLPSLNQRKAYINVFKEWGRFQL